MSQQLEGDVGDVGLEQRSGDAGRCRAVAGAEVARAHVVAHDAPVGGRRVAARAHAHPAPGAAHQAGQQRRAAGVAPRQLARALGALPGDRVGQRRVRAFAHVRGAADLAQVDAVLEHAAQARAAPGRVPVRGHDAALFHEAAQARDRLAVGATGEQLAHHRAADRVRAQPPGLQPPVAGRRLGCQVHAARDRVRARRVPVRPDPVEVVLGEREHQPQHQPAGVGGQVEPVLHGDERPAGGLDAVDQRQAVDQRTPEPVQHRHHQTLRHAGLDASDRLLQQRPVDPRAGLVELLEHLQHVHTARACPRVDLLALQRRRDEPLAGTTADL